MKLIAECPDYGAPEYCVTGVSEIERNRPEQPTN
jgi:hypothetical protein